MARIDEVVELNTNGDKIKIQFEPYLCNVKVLESTIELGKNSTVELLINKESGKQFYLWCEEFIESVARDYNSKRFYLDFRGRIEDYLDLEEIVSEKFNQNGWEIILTFDEVIENKNILEELESSVKKIEESGIKELKGRMEEYDIKNKIREIENDNEVEVAVIATMSSGKSTLINALAGSEIVPSKNEACTAKICKIKNDKELENFIYKEESDTKWRDVVLEEIQKLNNSKSKENIQMCGNFVGIESNEMEVLIVDTPGPNSAQNKEHKEVTFRYINDNSRNPLVLYILNATQLGTNDDADLLKEISEIIVKNGKQAEERFIFILNKIDSLDPEKESIESIIEQAKEYLNEFRIQKPNIFPVSAELAKIYRLKKTNRELSRAEKNSYNNYEYKFLPDKSDNYEGMKLIENSSLSNLYKKEIFEKIRDKGEESEESLIDYSGITAIELYINKYVNKYAKSLKVRNVAQLIKNILDSEINERTILVNNSDEELKQILEEIDRMEEELKNNDKKEKMEEELSKISTYSSEFDEFNNIIEKVEEKFTDIEEMMLKREERMEIALMTTDNVKMELFNLSASIKGKIEDLGNRVFKEIENRYEKIMRELYSSSGNEYLFDLKKTIDLKLKLEIPYIFSLEGAIHEKTEVVSRNPRQVLVEKTPIRKWWNPLTWFTPDYEEEYETIYDEITETRECVDLVKVFQEKVSPVKAQIRGELDNTRKEFEKGIEIIKEKLLKEMELIEQGIKKECEKLKYKIENKDNSEEALRREKELLEKVIELKESVDKVLMGEK